MLCKDVEEKIIDYIEDLLDKESYLAVEHHIKNCSRCQQEIKEIRESIGYIESVGNAMVVPEGFMESVKNKVEHNKKIGKKPKRRVGTAIFVAALIAVLITGVFAEEGIKSYFEEWKSKSLEESQSIEQLITEGYGEKLGISTEDQDIKITVESIMADDMNTVLLIEVEDLKGEKKYAPIIDGDGIVAEGKFNYEEGRSDIFKLTRAEVKDSQLLYTTEKNRTKTILSFNPVDHEYGKMALKISALEAISEDETRVPHAIGGQHYYDRYAENIVTGLWQFDINVKPFKSIVFDINEEMNLDGNKIVFDKLIISPTMTRLTYKFNSRQNKEYRIERLHHVKIEADGKIYGDLKGYGNSYINSTDFYPRKGAFSFDSMYFQVPSKIKITVGGYSIKVEQRETFSIERNQPFPQEFHYLGSKISVNSVQGDANLIRISMENLGERYFENLNFEILVNNKKFIETQYAKKFLFPEDEDRVYEVGYDVLLNNTTKILNDYPKEGYRVALKTFDYMAYEDQEKKVEDLKLQDTLDESIKSVRIQIEGYEENRNATGSVSFKLKKYKERPNVEK